MNAKNFDTCEADGRTKISVPRVLRTRGLADFLGISEATVRRWADAGLLPCSRIEGTRFFILPDVVKALRGRY